MENKSRNLWSDIKITKETRSLYHFLDKPGSWYKKHYAFLKVMNSMESDLLSFLRNHAIVVRKENKWFYCTSEFITEKLQMSSRTQTKWIKNLKRLGLIKTKSVGMPAKRYIKINEDNLLRLMIWLESTEDEENESNWNANNSEFPT